MEKINFQPNRPAYSMTRGGKVVGTQLDGGLARYRQDQVNAASLVQCQWVLTSRYDYDRFMDFFEGVAREGAVRFLMDLVIDYGDPTEYVCNFVPDTFNLVSINGNVHTVTAQIQAKPLQIDLDYRAALWMIDNEYGSLDDGLDVINHLNQFVNIDLPNTVGNIE